MNTLFDPAPAFVDRSGVAWGLASADEANDLLAREHYLGPMKTGKTVAVIVGRRSEVVAVQIWRRPTSRHLPSDGTWFELVRWRLTPAAGPNAGSRQHRVAVRVLRDLFPQATTLVSYSDPSVGHTGALYRACNWLWAPNWQRLRPPPTGGGDWGGLGRQEVKDRWVFPLQADNRRAEVLKIDDPGAIRHWLRCHPSSAELRRAMASPALDLAAAVEEK